MSRSSTGSSPKIAPSVAARQTHITHLFDKLSATNRVQLAIAAFRAGLVE
jgi:DNA-binding NarL/FixJ family response regulator